MGKIWGGRSIFCTLTIMPLCQKFKIIFGIMMIQRRWLLIDSEGQSVGMMRLKQI